MSSQLILEQINNVEKLGVAYQDANYLNDKNAEIDNYSIKLEFLASKIEKLYSNYSNLKDICDLEDINIQYIYNKVVEIKKSIKQDQLNLEELEEVRKQIDIMNKNLSFKWRTKIEDETKSIDSVINTLGSIVNDREEIALLRIEKAKFLSLQPGVASARKSIDAYKQIYNRLLKDLNFDDSILDFLSKLSLQRKLTLQDMDIEIFKWLKNNGFANKISISV